MPPLRILLVDDSPEFLAAASHFLSLEPWLQVVGLARSGAEAIEQTGRLNPDVVLLDLRMPGMNGLEATRRLKALAHPPRVVILTLHDEPEYRAALTAARADGFVYKGHLETELFPLLQQGFEPPDHCGS